MIPKNDTGWVKTQFTNLYKAPSGVYWMRAKIKGKLVRKSLKTRSFEIAQKKLKDRHEHETKALALAGSQTFGEVADEWMVIVNRNVETVASTKKVHGMTVEFLYRTWPALKETNVAKISNCDDWAARVLKKYCPGRYNTAMITLRSIFRLAIKRDLILENPTRDLKQATVIPKPASLPTGAQFVAMLSWLDSSPRTQPGAILVRVLAYTGMRRGEAKQLEPAMVDLERNELSLPGRITKNGHPRTVPIIPELKPLLEKLLKEYTTGRLLPVYDIRGSLPSACRESGAPRMTHHDLRKLFTTRCMESGVDVRTLAFWLGHRDGGMLLLKTYAHLRNEHSQAMSKLVKFG